MFLGKIRIVSYVEEDFREGILGVYRDMFMSLYRWAYSTLVSFVLYFFLGLVFKGRKRF